MSRPANGPTDRPLRVLLAGTAGLGPDQDHQRAMYAPAFAAHPGFEIVGSGTAPADLTRDDVDVVSVCVPMGRRVDVVATALRAGKDVLVDKPMSASVADCAAIADVVRETGRVCLPAHHQRFLPMIESAAASVAGGSIGLPWNVQADLLVAGGASVPGGELDNFAVYPVDVVLAMTGQPVRRVHARSMRLGDENAAAEDLAVLMLDHDHGLTSTIAVGRVSALDGLEPGAVAVHRYRVSGSHGVLDVDATTPGVTVRTAGRTDSRWNGADSVVRMLDEFHAAVRAARPSRPGPSDAAHVAQVLEAAHASIRTGQPTQTATVRNAS